MSKLVVDTCSECPMCAQLVGREESSYCQHPDVEQTGLTESFEDSDFVNSYSSRHPNCPLNQYTITIISGEKK